MVSIAMGQSTNSGILDTIIAANYEEYTEQRWQLREVFENHPRFAHLRRSPTPPPPASPPPADPAPPPPPLPSAKSFQPPAPQPKEKMSKPQRKAIASRERAIRLKLLRPDIPSIPKSLSNEQAIDLGGYNSQSEMDRDLLVREKELDPNMSSWHCLFGIRCITTWFMTHNFPPYFLASLCSSFPRIPFSFSVFSIWDTHPRYGLWGSQTSHLCLHFSIEQNCSRLTRTWVWNFYGVLSWPSRVGSS